MRQSIPKSILVRTRSVKEAMDFSNDYAPEHLILQLRDAKAVAGEVQNAGSVFVGPYSPERWAQLPLTSLNRSNNHSQLRRLRLWHEPHTPNKRIRSSVQRGQHTIFPKTYHFPRTHSKRIKNSWTYRRHTGRCGRARCPRKRS